MSYREEIKKRAIKDAKKWFTRGIWRVEDFDRERYASVFLLHYSSSEIVGYYDAIVPTREFRPKITDKEYIEGYESGLYVRLIFEHIWWINTKDVPMYVLKGTKKHMVIYRDAKRRIMDLTKEGRRFAVWAIAKRPS